MNDEDKKRSILFEDVYEVNISAFPHKNIDVDYFSNVIWGYKEGIDFLLDLILIFKDEMGDNVSTITQKSIYNRLAEILMSGFYSIFKKKTRSRRRT